LTFDFLCKYLLSFLKANMRILFYHFEQIYVTIVPIKSVLFVP
jgi:hypothetical protein